jgi:hypothetical protein
MNTRSLSRARKSGFPKNRSRSAGRQQLPEARLHRLSRNTTNRLSRVLLPDSISEHSSCMDTAAPVGQCSPVYKEKGKCSANSAKLFGTISLKSDDFRQIFYFFVVFIQNLDKV